MLSWTAELLICCWVSNNQLHWRLFQDVFSSAIADCWIKNVKFKIHIKSAIFEYPIHFELATAEYAIHINSAYNNKLNFKTNKTKFYSNDWRDLDTIHNCVLSKHSFINILSNLWIFRTIKLFAYRKSPRRERFHFSIKIMSSQVPFSSNDCRWSFANEIFQPLDMLNLVWFHVSMHIDLKVESEIIWILLCNKLQ